ncbi:centromere protein X [Cyanistes caeruleus]|uniref:centromere protein X n=1 Tax=Cyanistes caeruleus TaxID=156563 RepID=UPI000CDB9F4D|nr:centromere protein X [Cyanistes caeruleus]
MYCPHLMPATSSSELSRQSTANESRAAPAAAGGPEGCATTRTITDWAPSPASTPKRRVVAVNADAQLLLAELLKVFVREAAARAARQAQAEDLKKVDTEHLEKVLPQLLLDF